MKKIENLLSLWKNWKPTAHYPSPYRVTRYYYVRYAVLRDHKPLFPDGEINDIAAVIAGSKPTATITCGFNEPLGGEFAEIIRIAKKHGIRHSVVRQMYGNTHIFSPSLELENLMKTALQNHDFYFESRLLGYPDSAIRQYLRKAQRLRKKYGYRPYGSILATYQLNRQYLYWFHRVAPEFKISSDWFEKTNE